MRTVRRHDLGPRLELLPLLDVIFLLLTFFIYSFALMIRAEILPVALAPVGSGQRAAQTKAVAITIDGAGQLFVDKKAVSDKQLQGRLSQLAQQVPRPPIYLALQAQGSTDRGPALINLIEKIRRAGIEDFTIVGQPASASAAASDQP